MPSWAVNSSVSGATSDGGAAVVLCSMEYAKRHAASAGSPVRTAGVSTVTPTYPNTVLDLPEFATDSAAVSAAPELTYRAAISAAAYEEAGIGPDDIDLAEVYDLSTALELDWVESLGLCEEGEAEQLVRAGDTSIGGRIPVNTSGGLSSFGEAIRPTIRPPAKPPEPAQGNAPAAQALLSRIVPRVG